jgi:hypothetical protein
MKEIKDKVGGEHSIPENNNEHELHRAPDQNYTKAYLKILKDDYNIYYDGYGCHAFKVIPRTHSNPLIQLFTEDDGYLCATDITFDAHWAQNLTASLQLAITAINKKKMMCWPKKQS